MPTNLVEWTIRMVMLVLAGLVTLSILGSIAAISHDQAGFLIERGAERVQPDTRTSPEPVPEEPDTAAGSQAAASDIRAVAGGDTPSPGSGSPGPAGEQAPGSADEADRWLEAIAHALLALAGLAAHATLLLWRGVRQLRRIADRLETAPRNE
jgi:hypothetical protein